jgi:predicted RecA/RadA family phage recombinase
MVDITVTAASVTPQPGAQFGEGIAGETIAQGKVVALNDSKQVVLADSNSATASIRAAVGIAVNGASLGQPIKYQKAGDINIGATVVVGTTYALSETPGGIQPTADVGAGEYVSVIGTAITTSRIRMALNVTGASA